MDEGEQELPWVAERVVSNGSHRHQLRRWCRSVQLLRSALDRIGDPKGALLVGRLFKDFRAEFAADLDAQIFFPIKGDEEPFRQFAHQLQEVVRQLIRYSRAAIDKYLLDRQDLLVVGKYEGSSG